MENPNTAISMEKCIPISLDEKQQVGEERSDKTSLVQSVRKRKSSFNYFDRKNEKLIEAVAICPQTSKGLTDKCFSDRKTTLLTLAVLFLIGLSCALYFGKKTDDTKLSPEEAYAYGNFIIEYYQKYENKKLINISYSNF